MMQTAEIVVRNSGTPENTREIIFDELRNDLAEWMTTDRDMVWRPAIELSKEDNEFAARALVPGVDPGDVEVLIAPDVLMVRGEAHCGAGGDRRLLTSIKFPRPVNPRNVHAEIKDGMLSVRAEIARVSKTTVLVPQAA